MKPNEVKPFLLHEESLIRRFAAGYLSDGKIYDEDIMHFLLKAYRMEKDIPLRGFIAMHMSDFPQTEETLITLNRLARNVAKDRHHFEAAIANADVELILDSKEKFNFENKDLSNRLKYRIEIHEEDTDTLWNRILEILCESRKDYETFDFETMDLLSKELSSRDDIPMDKVHDLFEEYNYDDPYYDELFMCTLAGNLRLEEYSDLIIESLSLDWDYLNDEAMFALTKIRSPYIAKKIKNMFYDESEVFQIFASGTLGYMKIKEAEDALVSLFEKAEDDYIKSYLIFALCDLLSPYAIELGTPLLPDKYDTSFDSLEKNLYIVATLNGIDHPQLEKWREMAEEEEKRFRNTL